MSGKKLFLARVLGRPILKALRALGGPSLVVLNYHRVRREGAPEGTPFEDGVFGPSAFELERQMAWLSKNTEVLSEAEIIERVGRGKAFGTPSTLVTFDDGYVDNYETAFPILKKLGVPAIFFIPTALVSSRQLGWWDIVAYLVKRSRRESIRTGNDEISLADRSEAIRLLIARVKRQRQVEDGAISMELLSEACDVPLPPPGMQARELMTWEQIREVSRAGISIGSHTHTHPVLANLDRDRQRDELRISKEMLEREVGKPVRSIAYPFGGSGHYGKESMTLASECGYEIGFTFQGRANRGRQIDRYAIRRFKAPDEFPLMTASILLPEVFA